MDDLATCLIGVWIHSHEEDAPGVAVYRHPGYAFPPARGRRGFELCDDGEASLLGIAPTDGSRRATARWTLEGQTIRIEPEAGVALPVTFEVVSCEADVLRVKR